MLLTTATSTSLLFILLVLGVIIFWLYRENIKHRSDFQVLKLYSKDLTALAQENKLDPVIGREKEIGRVIEILSRRTKNNPVLIGQSGVGKTAIVEGLAIAVAAHAVPDTLQNKRVLALDLSGLVAGTKYRGEFEKRLKSLVDEIIAAQRTIILFIDEMHTLAEAGQATGAIDAADILKPALSRGELQVIGATTIEDYKKYVERDMTLERRFQPVMIEQPSKEMTLNILKGIRSRYETHHRLKISDDALVQAVELSDQYIHDRVFPDKAIDLMDEAAAKVKLRTIATHKTATPPSAIGSAEGSAGRDPSAITVTGADVATVMSEWKEIGLGIKLSENAKG